MNVVIAILLSYLMGSIPNGLICGKLLWGVDLREHGSHNIGATNAWRTLGKGPGIVIFLLDFLKGFISVWLGMHLVGTPLSMVLCGIVAILGHSCSVFLKFKGDFLDSMEYLEHALTKICDEKDYVDLKTKMARIGPPPQRREVQIQNPVHTL